MKATNKISSKTAEAQKSRQFAEGLLFAKGLDRDDQEALFGIEALLGGLLLMRSGAANAESWGNLNIGLGAELGKHLDKAEAVLKKYREGILYVTPTKAKATA